MITPNNYFDEIFVINLNRTHDRWKKIRERFRREGLFVKRIPGIDRMSPQIKKQFEKHRNKNETKIKKIGRYSVWRSFSKVLEHITISPYKTILLLEDDVLFHRDFDYLFDLTIKEYLPEDWQMWYLGSTQVNWTNVKIDENIPLYKPNGNTYGTYAVAFKTDFIKNNFKYYKRGLRNNDHFWAQLIDRTNVYVSYPKLIGHAYGYSVNADYHINESIAKKLEYFKYDQNIYY